ncbi:uncharacterized protein LOC135958346 [Calliphora vicina]|uniref:uncharacterized protein LOC135958346 n=1 Tax=Calliphora vicina TaxID=7373 RepID=UPI00325ACB95
MNISLFEDAYLRRIETIMQPDEINLTVVNALRFVMQNVFANITNALVITISSDKGPIQFWLHDIMAKLFVTSGFMAIQLVVLDNKTNRIDLPGKRYCNVIMIDSFKNLEKTSIAKYNRNFDSLEYYFIFLQTLDEFIPMEMENIFKYCFNNFWLHCNVMVQYNNGEVLIYTYFPFKDQQCFQTQPEIINKFNGERFLNAVMFPDKLKNLHMCSLKLTTWIVPPFVMNRTNGFIPNRKISGFEIFIMIAISREMNFTLDINVISIDTYQQNRTPESVPMKMLKNLETNMTVGYFRRTAKRDKIATSSYVTYYLPLVAVILRKQSKYESLSIFTFPFDSITWTLTLIFYGLIIILNNLNVDRRRVNNFQIYEILMGMSVKSVPKVSSKRIHFMTALLSSFFLRSVYQSLLFYLFRTHFYKSPPRSLEDLVAEGYKAVCNEMSLNFIANVPQVQDKSLPIITIYSANEMYPLYYLELFRDQNYAAISNYDFALYYAYQLLSVGDVLQVLPINVNDQQIGFYLAKHSYLVDRFNRYILRFQQAGLLLKWKEWSNFEYQISKQKDAATSKETVLMNNKHSVVLKDNGNLNK